MRIHRFAHEVSLAEAAADRIAELLSAAIHERGAATLALSGGTSPEPMFRSLAGRKLPWEVVHIYQVDERLVASDDPARNWSMIHRALVEPTSATGHPMPTMELPPVIDVVHLGLGADGHSASWPPGHDVLGSSEPVETVVGFNGYDRLTLTPVVVNRARAVLWYVPGVDKTAMVERLIAGDRTIPAGVVSRAHAELFTTA